MGLQLAKVFFCFYFTGNYKKNIYSYISTIDNKLGVESNIDNFMFKNIIFYEVALELFNKIHQN